MTNEGSKFAHSDELYERALKTIPTASQTFSKSAMNVVRGASPLFFERGDGCHVWDVDGNRYLDYMLGLLPIVLGYRDPDVDQAIQHQLERGITFSLATKLEVELAERLVDLIPCAEMVRFGKNGSDATSAAIRLARAHTGRDRIIHCGYHGWHDWYIGSTQRNLGVPQAIQDLSAKFDFNDATQLEEILRSKPDQFAAIILEPDTTAAPAEGFLERVRELADANGAVLIFDEIVTGFRLDVGGAQSKYGVTPDLACFGKSMANGMPISAVVGRREIMQRMDDIFFSGTFGGEALSLAAAIATIDKIVATDTVGRLHALGDRLGRSIQGILSDYGLNERYEVAGPNWRPIIRSLPGKVSTAITTSILRQELVEAGIFMGAGINLCLAHDNESVFEETLLAWTKACDATAAAFNDPDPGRHLRGHPIEPVFQVRG